MRELFYTPTGEFWPFDMPELEVTSLEEIEEARVVDFTEQDEKPRGWDLDPEEELDFD